MLLRNRWGVVDFIIAVESPGLGDVVVEAVVHGVDDLADACVFLMQHYNDSEIINVGVEKVYPAAS